MGKKLCIRHTALQHCSALGSHFGGILHAAGSFDNIRADSFILFNVILCSNTPNQPKQRGMHRYHEVRVALRLLHVVQKVKVLRPGGTAWAVLAVLAVLAVVMVEEVGVEALHKY